MRERERERERERDLLHTRLIGLMSRSLAEESLHRPISLRLGDIGGRGATGIEGEGGNRNFSLHLSGHQRFSVCTGRKECRVSILLRSVKFPGHRRFERACAQVN